MDKVLPDFISTMGHVPRGSIGRINYERRWRKSRLLTESLNVSEAPIAA